MPSIVVLYSSVCLLAVVLAVAPADTVIDTAVLSIAWDRSDKQQNLPTSRCGQVLLFIGNTRRGKRAGRRYF